MGFAIVQHLVINFVRHDRHLGIRHKTCNECIDLSLGGNTATRVGRRIDDQKPRFFSDQ